MVKKSPKKAVGTWVVAVVVGALTTGLVPAQAELSTPTSISEPTDSSGGTSSSASGPSASAAGATQTSPAPPAEDADWVRQPQGHPPDRFDAVMAPDSDDSDPGPEGVVLFSGRSYGVVLGGTWTWNGKTWTPEEPENSPPDRIGAALAYRSGDGKTVLFGGVTPPPVSLEYVASEWFNDTWEWDGRTKTWTNVTPERVGSPCDQDDGQEGVGALCKSPSPRTSASLAEDANGNLVLFGGSFPDGSLARETWIWDGDGWREVTPERIGSPCDQGDGQEEVAPLCKSPPARTGRAGFAYHDSDFTNRQTVLFGGTVDWSALLDDTWAWDGSTWRELIPQGLPGQAAKRPPGRYSAGMAYHRGMDRTVLFGGRAPGALRDTWTWDGRAWTEHSRPPAQRPPPDALGNGMAYWEPPSSGGPSAHVLVLSNAASADVPETDQTLLPYENNIQTTGAVLDTWTWDGTSGHLRVPEPDAPDTNTEMTLVPDPSTIWSKGTAPPKPTSSTLTATVIFRGDPAPNRLVRFEQTESDMSFESPTCITDGRGQCSTVVHAGYIRGELSVHASSGLDRATATITVEGEPSSCANRPSPERREGWWANLDPSFGCKGVADLNPGAVMTDMVVQADGKIVVLVIIYKDDNTNSTHLMRYTRNGALDTTFGPPTSPGMITIGASDKLALQRDGKLLTLGSVHQGRRPDGFARLIAVVSRFNPDGSPDNGDPAIDSNPDDETFGDGGTSSLGELMVRTELVVQPADGKILVGGTNNEGDEPIHCSDLFCSGLGGPAVVIRINPDGSPDNGVDGEDSDPGDSFGDAGRVSVTYSENFPNYISSIAIQRDDGKDKIVVGGGWTQFALGIFNTTTQWGLARLLPNGELDLSFNPCPSADGACGTGKAAPVFESNYESLWDLIVHDDGEKIVAVGTVREQGGQRLLMGRFERHGAPDASFNPCGPSPPPCGGKFSSDFGGIATGDAVAIQPQDGKYIVAGRNAKFGSSDGGLLARFRPDGTLDDDCGLPSHSSGGGKNVVVRPEGIIVGGGALSRREGGSLASAPSEITVEGSTVNEPKAGQSEAPFNVKLKLDAPACQPMAFDYATSDGTATAGQDYTQTNGTVMFQRGQQERIVPVPVLPDNHPEPPETFSMSVSNSVGLGDPTRPKELRLPVVKLAEGQAQILDPQPQGETTGPAPSQPRLSIGDTSVIETNQASTASLPVALNAPSKHKVTVAYRTLDDSAQTPGDYRAATGMLTFEPGQTQKTISVEITGDLVPEQTETFYVELKDPTGAALLRPKATATIYDDDTAAPSSSPALPSTASRVPTAAGLLLPGANFPPPSLAQGTQIQAQQQIQQQLQQQAQAQLMAGVMSERQRQAEVEKAGLSDKDAYLATARRQASPAFAWAFGWVAALAAMGASLIYNRQASSEPAANKVRRRRSRPS